jgi:hypothetical protein
MKIKVKSKKKHIIANPSDLSCKGFPASSILQIAFARHFGLKKL